MIDLLKFKHRLDEEKVLFLLNGPMSQSVMVEIGETLKQHIERSEESRSIRSRVFFVFVEQMQNIIRYSDEPALAEEEDARIGVIVVGKKNDHFFVSCGNRVTQEQASFLDEQLSIIQEMNAQELKTYYKKTRKQDPAENSKGAGLGFIDMARKASAPIDYTLAPLEEDKIFFSLTTII